VSVEPPDISVVLALAACVVTVWRTRRTGPTTTSSVDPFTAFITVLWSLSQKRTAAERRHALVILGRLPPSGGDRTRLRASRSSTRC
jgi:hypothetical protein